MAHPRENPYYSIVEPEPDGTHLSIAHTFRDVEHARRIFAGEEEGYAYACVGEGNPTVRGYERAIAELEAPQDARYDAIATTSGRSAILLTALQLLKQTGKKCIVTTPHLYGGTYSLFTHYLSTLGIDTILVQNPGDMRAWDTAITHDTAFVFVETISNPLASVIDLSTIASIAHNKQVYVVADNTIPTVLFKPFLHGADVVVYSASKSMNGDSRGLGGIIISNKGFIRTIRREWFSVAGSVMDPACAARMHKRLATLKTRVACESANALTLAEILQYTPGIYRVHYPLLERSPYRTLAQSLGMTGGAGGLLAFELTGSMDRAVRFIESLKMVIHATHLGHEKTLVTLPAATTHAKIPRALREKCGITDTLVRISAGCEEPHEFTSVIKDILRALTCAQSK